MIKKINLIIIMIVIVIGLRVGYISLLNNDFIKLLISLSIIPIMLIPYLLSKKLNITNNVIFIYLIFIILSQLLGSILNFYQTIPYYDKLIHMLSGILSSYLAIILLKRFNKYDNHYLVFNIIFVFAITFMIAGLWEIFEFVSDTLFNGDAQRVISTGVVDTMQDIISAFTGSIIFVILYLISSFKVKRG